LINKFITYFLASLLFTAYAEANARKTSYQAILSLDPVGYWPLVGGQGDQATDITSKSNHGRLINVSRDQNGLPNFRNAFQYIEFPAHESYQTNSFSFGGWVFLRQKPVGGVWFPRMGFQLFGHYHRDHQYGTQISIRRDAVPVATTSDPKHRDDALGNWNWVRNAPSKTGHGVLPLGSWQHVFFTYSNQGKKDIGTGTLYINGNVIARKDKVHYTPKKSPLVAGSNAAWWMQTISGATGLDGSLCHLIWFDRSLKSPDVDSVFRKTAPEVTPPLRSHTTVVVGTQWYDIENLPQVPFEARIKVLEELLNWKHDKLLACAIPITKALRSQLHLPRSGLLSTRLLIKLGNDHSDFTPFIKRWVKALEDPKIMPFHKAEIVLCLGLMGPKIIKEALPTLTRVLKNQKNKTESYLPNVEDRLMNALFVTIGRLRSDKKAKSVISDLTHSFNTLCGEHGTFLTQRGDGSHKEKDYTSSMIHKGITYQVGEGVAWEGVEKLNPSDYKALLNRISEKEREQVSLWSKKRQDHLYRVPLYRTAADGKVQKVYLEGENFVLDGSDAKLRGWSIFADEEGYIHLVGGQHNSPNSDLFIGHSTLVKTMHFSARL
jgi:hypothetical protein